ncbi:21793_t:CDS:1, partial [Rhizophagus irregularis]
WGEKNHNSGTKAYVFMENEERKKDVTFIWSDFVVTRIHDGKEPLILYSPKLVVFFTISTGYFIQSQEDDTTANIFKECEECIKDDNSNNGTFF